VFFVNSTPKIVKNTLLQTAFSAILPTAATTTATYQKLLAFKLSVFIGCFLYLWIVGNSPSLTRILLILF